MRQPLPVSPAPAVRPRQGDQGEIHGLQAVADWEAGDTQGRPTTILDELRAKSLWLVCVSGDVYVDLNWGTKATRSIRGLTAPCRMTIPGQFTINVRPRVLPVPVGGSHATASVTPVDSCCQAELRYFTSTLGAIDDGATGFVALTASTVTIAGVAVAVPVLGRVALIAGSVLTAGSGYVEFAI